jgi:hypothetical protein
MRVGIKRGRIQNGNAVPTTLDLDRKMTLEALR